MRQKTLPGDKKTTAFHIQPLETMDEQGAFHEGIALRLSHFEFLWVKKGRGSLTVDFQDYRFSENAIYCMSPGQYRKVKAESRLEGYYISLSADFYFTIKGEVDYFLLSLRFTLWSNLIPLAP